MGEAESLQMQKNSSSSMRWEIDLTAWITCFLVNKANKIKDFKICSLKDARRRMISKLSSLRFKLQLTPKRKSLVTNSYSLQNKKLKR